MHPLRVFLTFLGLGCRCFGGPVAHLAYYREAFVVRRGWLDERAYADLVALCQFLPGPTSSQVGMLIGWRQGGYAGMGAAWLGFTLPSALLMIGAALAIERIDPLAAQPWMHGMKLAVLAIVAQAVAGMWRGLCTDRWRAALALATAAAVLAVPQAWLQLPILAAAGFAGLLLPSTATTGPLAEPGPTPTRLAMILCLGLLAVGLFALPLIAAPQATTCADLFRTGSLVIGGGHVVLPLLTGAMVETGRLPGETLLVGYGLAQIVPGPMFSIAAFIGTVLHGVWGGVLATIAIFLPGALLGIAALPAWERLRHQRTTRRIADGLGAGVVGLLIAVLYDPVAASALQASGDAALACLALAALLLRCPAWLLVPACAGLTALLG